MLTLRALEWDYSSDLNHPPARWSCTFVESGSTSLLPGESVSRSGNTHALIEVTVDGSTERLLEGVVREWGFREGPDGVVSTVWGLDLKADLMDFRPSSPVAYRGMELLSDATAPIPTGAIKVLRLGSDSAGADVKAAFYQTWQRVASDVCSRAGLTASFDARDYDLGQDIVWGPDESAAEVLQTLLQPFNATERFKMDVLLESNSVRFAERGVATPDAVTVDYDHLLTREVRRFQPTRVNDVQVRGTTYRYPEPDFGDVVIAGLPSPNKTPYIISKRFVDEEAGPSTSMVDGHMAFYAPVEVAETLVTEYYSYVEASGKTELTTKTTTKNWFATVIRHPQTGLWHRTDTRPRTEYTEESFEYGGPHGELTRSIKVESVQDYATYGVWNNTGTDVAPVWSFVTDGSVDGSGTRNISIMYTLREESSWVYDAEGNVIYEMTKTYRADEPDPDIPAPTSSPHGLVLERETEKHYWSVGGQRLRSVIVRTYDRTKPGAVEQISTDTEAATGRASPNATTLRVPKGASYVGNWEAGKMHTASELGWESWTVQVHRRLATAQVSAGPDDAQLSFEFPLLGNPNDCEYFRGKIRTERNSVRYEADLTMLPDLNVEEGMNLTIAGAPSRWERSTFYLDSRTVKPEPDGMTMSIQGLAWI